MRRTVRACLLGVLAAGVAAGSAQAAVAIKVTSARVHAPGAVSGAIYGFLGPTRWPLWVSVVPAARMPPDGGTAPSAPRPPTDAPFHLLGRVGVPEPWPTEATIPFR